MKKMISRKATWEISDTKKNEKVILMKDDPKLQEKLDKELKDYVYRVSEGNWVKK